MVARSRADILAARGVKPTLSPNLSVLATVEALDVKRLLFIGVGCQVHMGWVVGIDTHAGVWCAGCSRGMFGWGDRSGGLLVLNNATLTRRLATPGASAAVN